MISSQAKCATARCRAGYSPALAGLRPARWQECHRGRQKCLRHVGPKMAKLQSRVTPGEPAIFARGKSRLKAGCGQNCPPHGEGNVVLNRLPTYSFTNIADSEA